jgi:hypothetical protein
MNKKEQEKKLAEYMKKTGATAVPQESTYAATAQEQAMKGDVEGANDTMQYGLNEASKRSGEQAMKKKLEALRAKFNKGKK